MLPHLFHSIHAIQELVCDRVQLQQIHTVEGSLQQLKDGRELKRSNGFQRKKHEINLHLWIQPGAILPFILAFVMSIYSRHFYNTAVGKARCRCAVAHGGMVDYGNGFTFTFSFPASLSFCSLYSPSQGLTADGGAKQAHLQWGPEVMVSTV